MPRQRGYRSTADPRTHGNRPFGGASAGSRIRSMTFGEAIQTVFRK